ncbi:MAG: cytochrome d ubiquinol oxidase subunit II [Alphaproteobacteria bacterium]|nr:cytochrome d ubiquinol oxidase subunit II [Alphaproteobacteria bacterium]
MSLFGDPAIWLPLVFAGLMGLSILIYVVLDGFDLGVGILFLFAEEDDKDIMVSSIGPFWDANETWLVMAVGLLLVAFPAAHGIILTALYVPVALLLVGLILRGVAFEFRAKADRARKPVWNRAFLGGSLLAALSQGFMLGLYIMGLKISAATLAFAALTAVCLAAGYGFIGACWLLMKTEGALQARAAAWARRALLPVALGMGAVSLASPIVSPRIYDKWFAFPELLLLSPLPVLSLALLGTLFVKLRSLPTADDRGAHVPFLLSVALFALAFLGLAYSFYPYVVPERLTIFEAASAPESLIFILAGASVVLPIILGYTAFAYTVFRGKASELTYD